MLSTTWITSFTLNLRNKPLMSNAAEGDPEEGRQDHSNAPFEYEGQSASENADRLPKIIPFDQLARCGEEIWIECSGQIYRLRRTRQGKLILTK